jgi:hypothetical protein
MRGHRKSRAVPEVPPEVKRETEPGDMVRFTVADVFLPVPGGVFAPPSGDTQLEGKVVGFSDSGSKPRAFAVVEVTRREMVVVPVEKLELVSGPGLPEESVN